MRIVQTRERVQVRDEKRVARDGRGVRNELGRFPAQGAHGIVVDAEPDFFCATTGGRTGERMNGGAGGKKAEASEERAAMHGECVSGRTSGESGIETPRTRCVDISLRKPR
jgi:hypothetical protein